MHTSRRFTLKVIALAAFCLVLQISSQSTYAQINGLVSHWPGEGNANDVVGGNNGTLQGGAVFGPGVVGQAFILDGTRYIEVPDSPSVSITGSFTLEAWINLNDNAGQFGIIEKYDPPGQRGYFLRLGGGKLVSSVCSYPLTCSTYSVGATTVTAGEWHHVVSVFDGTSIKVYLDGILDGSVPTDFTLPDGSTSLKIGARGDDANTRLNGLIDEVKIYNRALSASEIQNLVIPPDQTRSYSREAFINSLCPTAATTTIDFSTRDDGTPITFPDADSYFQTLTLSGTSFRDVRSYYNQAIYTFPTAVIRVDLPPNTLAFATDLTPSYQTPGAFTITLSTGQTYQLATDGFRNSGTDLDFFSVISSTPIEWATFAYNNDYLVIDNFTVATGCDSTPAVITPTITGTLGNNGWYTSDVGVSWSVTDPESTVSSSSGCDATNVTTDTSGVILTCTATSAGGSDTQSVTIKRDATAPSISCGSADGSWHASDVSIACAGSDSISQLANAGDASFSLITNVTSGSETANAATDSRDVCDHAGNCSAAGPITGNKVDRKAPTITITTPTNAVYVLNQAVTASFNCQDGGSGVANCNGTAANGANVDTASVGSKTFTVSAADNVANEATPQSVSYTVSFGIGVLYDQTKAAKSGSTIPIKIQLVDALGHNMSSAGLVVHAASLVQIATTASETINDAGSSNPDANFRFDSSLGSSGGYIFNLKTTGLPTGTYRLGFTVDGDPTVYTVQFAVRQ